MNVRIVERLFFIFAVAPLFHFVRFDLLLCLAGVASLFLFTRWYRKRKNNHYHIAGHVAPGFEKVADVYRNNITSGQEQGSAFAVYHKGELVVDLWGGYADLSALRLRESDSIGMFYSATKAVTAIVMAVLVDRGLLSYEETVSKYWPEFGQFDKEHVQVKTLLSHQAGLLAITDKHKLALLRDDPGELAELLARQTPLVKPGISLGYHTLTFGLYADQLVRKVDKRGRNLAEFFRDEIAKPFDIDFYIGQPKSLHYRSCRETHANFGVLYFFTTVIPVGIVFLSRMIYSYIRFGTFYLSYLIGNPVDWKPRRLNDPTFREVPSGASHGFGTARALAKLMGILGNGGSHDGKILLSKERIDYLNIPHVEGLDRVVLRHLTYGPGTVLEKVKDPHVKGKFHYAFGHWGAGGQMAYSDPRYHIGWAYNTNFCNILHGFVIDHRYTALSEAMYECVYALEASKSE